MENASSNYAKKLLANCTKIEPQMHAAHILREGGGEEVNVINRQGAALDWR
jgi:hypothetical protein